MTGVSWKKGTRIRRSGRFTLNFTAAEVFPLLCPVEEAKWLPGWKCMMVYSESGVAERDAVFTTMDSDGLEIVWSCITYEPGRFIVYSIVKGTDTVERLSIRLSEQDKGSTELEWSVLATGFSPAGVKRSGHCESEAAYQQFLLDRKREMLYYLENGKMIS